MCLNYKVQISKRQQCSTLNKTTVFKLHQDYNAAGVNGCARNLQVLRVRAQWGRGVNGLKGICQSVYWWKEAFYAFARD